MLHLNLGIIRLNGNPYNLSEPREPLVEEFSDLFYIQTPRNILNPHHVCNLKIINFKRGVTDRVQGSNRLFNSFYTPSPAETGNLLTT